VVVLKIISVASASMIMGWNSGLVSWVLKVGKMFPLSVLLHVSFPFAAEGFSAWKR